MITLYCKSFIITTNIDSYIDLCHGEHVAMQIFDNIHTIRYEVNNTIGSGIFVPSLAAKPMKQLVNKKDLVDDIYDKKKNI